MLRTLQSARQAMNLEQTRIDTLANNLANVATSGFKQVLTRVVEMQPMTGRPAGDPSALSALGGAGAMRSPQAIGKSVTLTHIMDPRPGQVQSSGRDTDFALVGRGFFVLQDTEGNEFYTRGGSFSIDDAGKLVSPGGQLVQSTSGPIEATGGRISVDNRGNLSINGAQRGTLRVVDFDRPENLQHRGDGLLTKPQDMEATEVPGGETQVMQGYLEGSNVDPVQTLVNMIAAQRAFEVESKVLQANDEMLGKSVNTLGRTT